MNKLFYRPDELAQMFGVSLKTIRRFLDDDKIVHIHLGRQIRIPQSEVDRLLAAGMVTACLLMSTPVHSCPKK